MSSMGRPRNPWPEEDVKSALNMVKKGLSYHSIAASMGKSYSEIQTKMSEILGDRKRRYIWAGYAEDGEWIAAAITADDLGIILMQETDAIRRREYRYRTGKAILKLACRFPVLGIMIFLAFAIQQGEVM